ncbi:MAG: sporulation protein [Ruminiclostridium sp.]|nr:sporulation protein [Ruminiclostridium sp.]
MRHWGRTLLGGFLLLSFALLLFLFPAESGEAARKGVRLCLDLIIPSLFPFFVLSSLVISTGLAGLLATPLKRPANFLLSIGSQGATLLVLGAVGGYPVGARSLAQMTARGDLSPQEARHLYLFCNNCGPAFFIGVVGGELFGSQQVGLLLWGTHLLAALMIGLFCRRSPSSVRNPSCHLSSLSDQFPEAVGGAFQSTLNVCSYVILFSVITGLLRCSQILPESPLWRSLCAGVLEISTGITTLGEAVSSPAALPLAAFLLGWGGCSVHCQTLLFWRELGLPAGPYLLAKLCQGLLAAGLTLLYCRIFPPSLPVMAPVELTAPVSLLGREMTALWALAGLLSLFHGKNSGKKHRNPL